MLNRPPSLPALGSGYGEGTKPNPLLIGYGGGRNNGPSQGQHEPNVTGSILKDFKFGSQILSKPVGHQNLSKAEANVDFSQGVQPAVSTFTTWAPHNPKASNMGSVPLRAVAIPTNPTGHSISHTPGSHTPLAPATTPLTTSFHRPELNMGERHNSLSLHGTSSPRQFFSDATRHPRPEDLREIANLNSRLSEANAIIDDLRKQLAKEKQLNSELQSRVNSNYSFPAVSPFQSKQPTQVQETGQARNPFGGTTLMPQTINDVGAPSAFGAIGNPIANNFPAASHISSHQTANYSNAVHLGRAASVGVLPRQTIGNIVTQQSQLLASRNSVHPIQPAGVQVNSRDQMNAVTQPPTISIYSGLQSQSKPATIPLEQLNYTSQPQEIRADTKNASVLEVTGRKDATPEDNVLDVTSAPDFLRAQAKLKEANNRIRYLAEENDRLVARLLKLKVSEVERQKAVEEQQVIKDSFSKYQSAVKDREAQLEAEIAHLRTEYELQHQHTAELLAISQQLHKQLEQQRSRQEPTTTEAEDISRVGLRESAKAGEPPAGVNPSEPLKKKKKLKEEEPIQSNGNQDGQSMGLRSSVASQQQQQHELQQQQQQEELLLLEQQAAAPKPKKKKKAVASEEVDQQQQQPAENTEKPKKPKKKAV
jgi:hypothetical protein